jgi:hypothetical protein
MLANMHQDHDEKQILRRTTLTPILDTQQQERHLRSSYWSERLTDCYWRIACARRRRNLAQVELCFRDQPSVLPIECSEAIARLDNLRRTTRVLQGVLCMLDPEVTQRLRPYPTIEKLSMLDYQLTEIILCVAMLAPICQAISYERIALHLHIRSLFSRFFATYEDTARQLAVLIDRAAQLQHEEEEGGTQA